jgi:ribosome-binding protein aMBF1 (putative translation factor)
MKCEICNKDFNNLGSAIYKNKVIKICESCSRIENLPKVNKPTQDQLDKANQRYSVHDRMMKMSGLDKLNPVSHDHEIAQRHLAKIKIPEKKQFSDILVPNYDWNIMMARRRRKMTINQLSEITRIPIADLNNMEKGILPKNYDNIARVLENVLNLPLLKETEERMRLMPVRKKSEEELLRDARERLFGEDIKLNEENEIFRKREEEMREAELEAQAQEEKIKEEVRNEVKAGKFDFSDKKNLKNVTLNDLVEMKKERERAEKKSFEEGKK